MTAEGLFSTRHRALSVGILLTVTAIACEGMSVSTVLPSVAVDLGGLGDYGWAFSAFMLASLVGAISAGDFADRNNPRLPARLGFAAFALGLFVAGLAPAWAVFLLGRAIQGFGAGSLIAVAYVAVARGYPEPLRPRLMALLSSAWVIPALVGPAVAGQVAEHASWRWVFIGIVPAVGVGAWMMLASLSSLDDTPSEANRPSRVLTALRLTGGVALCLLAASQEILPLALGMIVLGVVLGVPALARLLPDGTFVARSGLPAAVGLRGLLAFGFFGAEALIPLGLTTERGISPSLVGLSLTAGALAWVLGSWAQARAETVVGGSMAHRAVRAAAGLLFVLVGILGAAAVIVNPGLPFELVVVAWALGGFGMGVAYPAATLTALGTAMSGEEGAAAASLQVAETIGTAVGTGAAGALFAMSVQMQRGVSDGLTWGFLLASSSVVIAAIPALRLAPPAALKTLLPRFERRVEAPVDPVEIR